ncbi:MAG: 2,3,4,5-tetrahydropyridine-2,6-dicarboxylate N-succinyltransferase [Acidiphilium sp.]|nr:2,3,4,5-tetrahydropyridine-2,6-dicarboxylate N-succinyltransferase [Acidiphilium sp.]MDD4934906.1 2,3,4,5-tetrahydropyridine-2,6-dicarboxylate N-succinyltransferase [Acidiphilium sp.]
MDQASLEMAISALWQRRDTLVASESVAGHEAVAQTLDLLDRGLLRVAEPKNGGWIVHQWLKQAILLSFRLMPNILMPGAGGTPVYDKVSMKFADWDDGRFAASGIRVVPGAVVRHAAHVASGAVLMPCFINVGARIGENTMIDTWSTVGSCAQVGRNCHISGGVGIGGVLEPLQANPVIIEDDCFIGARSEVAEGVIVEQGAVLSMGVFLGASTRIVDRATGEVIYGRVPAYSVVVPGSLPGKPLPDGSAGPSLACAVIVKRVDAQTRAKTAVNELLRA